MPRATRTTSGGASATAPRPRSPRKKVAAIEIPPETIASRAFEVYCARGGGHGRDLEDWLQAERELRAALGH